MIENRSENKAWKNWERESARNRKKRGDNPKGKITSIGEALARWAEGGNRPEKMAEAALKNDWEKILGKQVANHAMMVDINFGRLIVSVQDPAWRYELFFMRDDMLEKINKAVGKEIIKEIVFTG